MDTKHRLSLRYFIKKHLSLRWLPRSHYLHSCNEFSHHSGQRSKVKVGVLRPVQQPGSHHSDQGDHHSSDAKAFNQQSDTEDWVTSHIDANETSNAQINAKDLVTTWIYKNAITTRMPRKPHLSHRCLAITTLGHPGFSYNSDAKDKHFPQISMTQEALRWLQMTQPLLILMPR